MEYHLRLYSEIPYRLNASLITFRTEMVFSRVHLTSAFLHFHNMILHCVQNYCADHCEFSVQLAAFSFEETATIYCCLSRRRSIAATSSSFYCQGRHFSLVAYRAECVRVLYDSATLVAN